MAPGIPVALALLAGAPAAADYGPEVAAPPQESAKPSEPSCAEQAIAHPNAIVVCAQRPQGYRINRDIMEAKREKQRQDSGRPTKPGTLTDNSCKMVGPMGCRGYAGINVIGAALTAAEMAARISRGQEIGSMFVTDPQKSEYEFYAEAKKRREAEEAAAAAAAKTQGTAGP